MVFKSPFGTDAFLHFYDKRRSIDFGLFFNTNVFIRCDMVFDEREKYSKHDLLYKHWLFDALCKDIFKKKYDCNLVSCNVDYGVGYYIVCSYKYLFWKSGLLGLYFKGLYFGKGLIGSENVFDCEIKGTRFIRLVSRFLIIYGEEGSPAECFDYFFQRIYSVSMVFNYLVSSRLFAKISMRKDFHWLVIRVGEYISRKFGNRVCEGVTSDWSKSLNYHGSLSVKESKVVLFLIVSEYLDYQQVGQMVKAVDSSFRSRKYDKSAKAKKARKLRSENKQTMLPISRRS